MAETNGSNAAQPIMPDPGCTTNSTPAKPVATAIQRRAPTTSPRINPDITVINNGVLKAMTFASASDIFANAPKNSTDEASSMPTRNRCSGSFRVRSRSNDWRGEMSMNRRIPEVR